MLVEDIIAYWTLHRSHNQKLSLLVEITSDLASYNHNTALYLCRYT